VVEEELSCERAGSSVADTGHGSMGEVLCKAVEGEKGVKE